jgi:hypothetical protein
MSSRCYLIPVDEEIAVKGAKFRHDRDLGLGDALIYATAIREGQKSFDEHHLPKVGALLGSESRHQRSGVGR